MEFWGVEVKPGKPVKVQAEFETLLHISQASLGDCKGKKGESVPLFVKVGDQKLVLGILHTENIPQISCCDLVFEKEFELSHNWPEGSVYFAGFKSPNCTEEDYISDAEEEEKEVPATVAVTTNGTGAKAAAKSKAKPAEVKKNVKPESADDDEEDDSDSEEGMDCDEEDEDSEEEEETTPKPKKPESSKKRANEAASKTPVSAKKAKTAITPQKTEEKKKGGHIAKKGGKTPTTATQSPKSASEVSCGSCKKTFNSGKALESHNKSKHSAAK